jgi:hypothetical protein
VPAMVRGEEELKKKKKKKKYIYKREDEVKV